MRIILHASQDSLKGVNQITLGKMVSTVSDIIIFIK